MIKRLFNLAVFLVFTLNQLAYGFVGNSQNLPPALNPTLLGINISDTISFNLNIPKNTILTKDQRTTLQTNINYFLTALTVDDKDLWVNLNPKEPDRMIGSNLAYTDMGKHLLLLDLKLKKDTSFALFPGLSTGATTYWERVFAKAKQLQTNKSNKLNIPTTFRVWIVPDKAEIYETKDGCVITKSSLKVMLESEYLKQTNNKDELQAYCEVQLKELILPNLTNKVNSDPTYEPLRQIYNAIILAKWYKQKVGADLRVRPNNNIGQTHRSVPTDSFSSLINTNNLNGLISKDILYPEQVFAAYLDSVKQGEYHLSKTSYNKELKSNIRRSYVSGGVNATAVQSATVTDAASRRQMLEVTSRNCRAEAVLGRSISPEESAAIEQAHQVGQGHLLGPQNPDGTYQKHPDPSLAYTGDDITEKDRYLAGYEKKDGTWIKLPEEVRKNIKFTKEERRKLIEHGVAGEEQGKRIAIVSPRTLRYGKTLLDSFKEIDPKNTSIDLFAHDGKENIHDFLARIREQNYDLVIVNLHGSADEVPVAFEDFGCKTIIVVHRASEAIERNRRGLYKDKDWNRAFSNVSRVVLLGRARVDDYRSLNSNVLSIPYGFSGIPAQIIEDKHFEAGVAIGSRTLWSEMRSISDVIGLVREVRKLPAGEKVFGYVAGSFRPYKDPVTGQTVNEIETLRTSSDCIFLTAQQIEGAYGDGFNDHVSFKKWLYEKSENGNKLIIVEGDFTNKKVAGLESSLIDFSAEMYHEIMDGFRPKDEYSAALHRNPGSRVVVGFKSGSMDDMREEGLAIIDVDYRADGTINFSPSAQRIIQYIRNPAEYNKARQETWNKARTLSMRNTAQRYLDLVDEVTAVQPQASILTMPTDELLAMYRGDCIRSHARRVNQITELLVKELISMGIPVSEDIANKIRVASAVHDNGAPNTPILPLKDALLKKGVEVPSTTSRDIDWYYRLRKQFEENPSQFTQDEIDCALDIFQGPAALHGLKERGISLPRTVEIAVLFHHHVFDLNDYLAAQSDWTEEEKQEARLILYVLTVADKIENGMNMFKKIYYRNTFVTEDPNQVLAYINKRNVLVRDVVVAYQRLISRNDPGLVEIERDAKQLLDEEIEYIRRRAAFDSNHGLRKWQNRDFPVDPVVESRLSVVAEALAAPAKGSGPAITLKPNGEELTPAETQAIDQAIRESHTTQDPQRQARPLSEQDLQEMGYPQDVPRQIEGRQVIAYRTPTLSQFNNLLLAHPGRGGSEREHQDRHIHMSPEQIDLVKNLSPEVQREFWRHEVLGHLAMPYGTPESEIERPDRYPTTRVRQEASDESKALQWLSDGEVNCLDSFSDGELLRRDFKKAVIFNGKRLVGRYETLDSVSGHDRYIISGEGINITIPGDVLRKIIDHTLGPKFNWSFVGMPALRLAIVGDNLVIGFDIVVGEKASTYADDESSLFIYFKVPLGQLSSTTALTFFDLYYFNSSYDISGIVSPSTFQSLKDIFNNSECLFNVRCSAANALVAIAYKMPELREKVFKIFTDALNSSDFSDYNFYIIVNIFKHVFIIMPELREKVLKLAETIITRKNLSAYTYYATADTILKIHDKRFLESRGLNLIGILYYIIRQSRLPNGLLAIESKLQELYADIMHNRQKNTEFVTVGAKLSGPKDTLDKDVLDMLRAMNIGIRNELITIDDSKKEKQPLIIFPAFYNQYELNLCLQLLKDLGLFKQAGYPYRLQVTLGTPLCEEAKFIPLALHSNQPMRTRFPKEVKDAGVGFNGLAPAVAGGGVYEDLKQEGKSNDPDDRFDIMLLRMYDIQDETVEALVRRTMAKSVSSGEEPNPLERHILNIVEGVSKRINNDAEVSTGLLFGSLTRDSMRELLGEGYSPSTSSVVEKEELVRLMSCLVLDVYYNSANGADQKRALAALKKGNIAQLRNRYSKLSAKKMLAPLDNLYETTIDQAVCLATGLDAYKKPAKDRTPQEQALARIYEDFMIGMRLIYQDEFSPEVETPRFNIEQTLDTPWMRKQWDDIYPSLQALEAVEEAHPEFDEAVKGLVKATVDKIKQAVNNKGGRDNRGGQGGGIIPQAPSSGGSMPFSPSGGFDVMPALSPDIRLDLERLGIPLATAFGQVSVPETEQQVRAAHQPPKGKQPTQLVSAVGGIDLSRVQIIVI